MVHGPLAVMSVMSVMSVILARQLTNRVRLRVLVQDDPWVPVFLSFVRMLRRYQRHDSQGARQNQ
jgi:hypothetical protein